MDTPPPNLSLFVPPQTQPPLGPSLYWPERKSRQWINENAAGPKGKAERMEDKEWETETGGNEGVSAIRKADLDGLNDS